MPLPKPSLDNRSFEQLVAEGRSQLPRLAPGWTDHNASDPGITLLELAAWMSEQAIYRLDRLPPEAARSFVRLMGVEPAPAPPARCVVGLANPGPGLALPARMQLCAAAAPGATSAPLMETTEPVWVSPAQLVALRAGAGLGRDISTEHAQALQRDPPAPWWPFGPRPRPGHAFYLGFDRALDAPGQPISLHVWSAQWHADDAVRMAVQAQHQEDEALAASAPGGSWTAPPWQRHYRVRTVWEYHQGAGHWAPLPAVQDSTRALSLSGFVRFDAPVGHAPWGPGGPFYVRCRIAQGRFECAPQLLQVAINAVGAEHAISQPEQALGLARGQAGQTFALGQSPAMASSVRLRLDDGAGSVQTDWTCVADWDRVGPHDHALRLDAERGVLHSGNGLRGQAPPAGHQLWASWQVGGGPRGHLPAGALTQLPPNPHNLALQPGLAAPAPALAVQQALPSVGGEPAQTLAQAQAEAFERATAMDKAVTLADIERLALATPGVPVARVRAVADFDARQPCVQALGVVSVVVIPPCPLLAPMPSQAMLCAVQRWLEPRRLVTSELQVMAPRYRRVGVQATLHLACGSQSPGLVAAANACVAALFDPLTGGPGEHAGRGWPFGRTVYRNDVMAALSRLPGVTRVTGFGLLAGGAGAGGCGSSCGGGCSGGCGGTCGGCDGGNSSNACTSAASATNSAGCANVDLCPHELPRPGHHRWVVESDTTPVLIRSLPHECPTA